jgi:hypothetical protein
MEECQATKQLQQKEQALADSHQPISKKGCVGEHQMCQMSGSVVYSTAVHITVLSLFRKADSMLGFVISTDNMLGCMLSTDIGLSPLCRQEEVQTSC